MEKLGSIIIPVYNEFSDIASNLRTIQSHCNAKSISFEFICIDDGSRDGTADKLKSLSGEDPRIKPVIFSRNFGKEAAIEAGLAASKGDFCIVMDSDLQHPPKLIPRMIDFWQSGHLLVEGMKEDRSNDGPLKKLTAKIFYWLLNKFSGINIEGHTDFKLLDRSIVKFYLHIRERHKFFRGLIEWTKIPSAKIPFEVPPRSGDSKSKWSMLKLVKYSFINIASFSYAPLILLGWIGFFVSGASALFGIFSFVKWALGESLPGFTTIIILASFFGGFLLLNIGILAYYISIILDEVRHRPPYYILGNNND